MSAAGRPSRQSAPWLRVLLGLGVVLALGATVLVVIGDEVRWLRLAAVLALWAALIGAFAVSRSRREARAAEMRQDESRRTYELELQREVSARREHEVRVVEEARGRARDEVGAEYLSLLQSQKTELAGLREQLDRLTSTLAGFMEGDLLVERLTLSAESTRVRQLGDARQRTSGGPRVIGPASPASLPPAPAVTPAPSSQPSAAMAQPPFRQTQDLPVREDDTVTIPEVRSAPRPSAPLARPQFPPAMQTHPEPSLPDRPVVVAGQPVHEEAPAEARTADGSGSAAPEVPLIGEKPVVATESIVPGAEAATGVRSAPESEPADEPESVSATAPAAEVAEGEPAVVDHAVAEAEQVGTEQVDAVQIETESVVTEQVGVEQVETGSVPADVDAAETGVPEIDVPDADASETGTAETDVTETDVIETDVIETDVTETETETEQPGFEALGGRARRRAAQEAAGAAEEPAAEEPAAVEPAAEEPTGVEPGAVEPDDLGPAFEEPESTGGSAGSEEPLLGRRARRRAEELSALDAEPAAVEADMVAEREPDPAPAADEDMGQEPQGVTERGEHAGGGLSVSDLLAAYGAAPSTGRRRRRSEDDADE